MKIKKLKSSHNNHNGEDNHNNEEQNHYTSDTHIWISPKISQHIATNIYNQLIIKDSANKQFYTKNYKQLIVKLQKIHKQFKALNNIAFIASNNVWGYLAKEYNYEILEISNENKQSNIKTISLNIDKIKNRNKINTYSNKSKYKIILADKRQNLKMSKLISANTNIDYIAINPIGDIFKIWGLLLKEFAKTSSN
jgi:zinc transport system substrate-binding protein